jgi:hypothetical protein
VTRGPHEYSSPQADAAGTDFLPQGLVPAEVRP